MTQLSCTYGDDRDGAIVAFLYDDPDTSAAERAGFEAHLQGCARCQAEVAALRPVRAQLARWSPPEPSFTIHGRDAADHRQPGLRNPSWWRAVPAWAQVAAALLFLGVSAGIANLDIQYNQSGLSIRTGWSAPARPSAAPAAPERSAALAVAQNTDLAKDAPWRTDIAALERQLKSEIRASQASGGASVRTTSAAAIDAEVSRRVQAIVAESEKRQQRELALRV